MQNDCPRASQNQIKNWARLTQAKFRREDGLLLAEGIKVVEELLKSDWEIEALLVLPDKISHREAISFPRKVPAYQLSHSEFKKLSQDKEPEGILAVVKIRQQPLLKSFLQTARGHLLIGHEISNPQNLGALLRTSRWFGFSGIVLGINSVDWTHPKVIRSSMGTVFHLTILPDVELKAVIPEIKRKFKLIGSDVREGIPPHPAPVQTALLLGSESHGLPENLLKLADERWRIPGLTQTESLSLPQAAAIMMHELTKTRTKEQG